MAQSKLPKISLRRSLGRFINSNGLLPLMLAVYLGESLGKFFNSLVTGAVLPLIAVVIKTFRGEIEKNDKQIHMTKSDAEGFYEVHKERPFFDELTSFMSSGKCVVLSLQRDNAIAKWREVIGATNPEEAEVGTFRKLYAEDIGRNAVHGSDSDENAIIESSFFFKMKKFIKFDIHFTLM